MNEEYRALGRRFAEARKKVGLTVAETATLLDLRRSQVDGLTYGDGRYWHGDIGRKAWTLIEDVEAGRIMFPVPILTERELLRTQWGTHRRTKEMSERLLDRAARRLEGQL